MLGGACIGVQICLGEPAGCSDHINVFIVLNSLIDFIILVRADRRKLRGRDFFSRFNRFNRFKRFINGKQFHTGKLRARKLKPRI